MFARITAFTHSGRVRESNEDTIVVGDWVSVVDMSAAEQTGHELSGPLICVVADGMGGHRAGEVASRYVARRLAGEQQGLSGSRRVGDLLETIDAELYQAMAADESLAGMGTTVVGLVLAPTMIWFNVGDSRLYRFASGGLQQLSIDDTLPGPRTGMITQSLGGLSSLRGIEPHIGEEPLDPAARYLLCSDGLTDMIDDSEIAECLTRADVGAVERMVDLAMRAGGLDNISIALVSFEARGGH